MPTPPPLDDPGLRRGIPAAARRLLEQLAARADELRQLYPAALEHEAVVALTTFVTALAMNYVHGGSYAP